MSAMMVNGKEIGQTIRMNIALEVERLKRKYNTAPAITTITIGNNPASELYLRLRNAACNEVGIISKVLNFEDTISEEELLTSIQNLNVDPAVHGIFIQYPVPSQISPINLMRMVAPKKDVEGFNPENLGRTLIGDEHLVPCTPLSVLTILNHEHVPIKGKNIVIVNHSNVVGKPLAALLLTRNATVSVCHVFTENLMEYTKRADVLITGAGVPHLVTGDHIKTNAVVIDVGITETDSGIRGDVDVESTKHKASMITPVPGGVGPVTIASALSNMLKTFQNCLEQQ